ncbi:MAG: hypothetical protein Gaeavirus8_18 [Gaeavirus sp.]|uniref:Calcineurin-like phosphoesterase domain-containing protein n=1 Tax=Gaeavirus sp. TaxID=2487767 RepID=A0A3G4ZYV1_9VIRU|nr:MAG: hypothetical protein Gaeavirus8_18 [Gaeavirus sp.]
MIEQDDGFSGIFTSKSDSIYIMGDIHGDYQCFIHCLVDLCQTCSVTELIDDTEFNYMDREILEWNPGCSSTVVFCGDLIHRKRFADHVLDDECSDIYIIKTLLRLKKDAIKNNGNIIIISGNHEIMSLLQPDENVYTSPKNLAANLRFFTDKKFINEYIKNSYAWIKINDILITHGGLCSDYLDFIDTSGTDLSNMDVVKFINDKYHEYFTNFNYKDTRKDKVGYNLFIEYDTDNKKKHNMFWCREWGYSGIDCDKYKKILSQVECTKMIIAHCPQFLSPDKPKMINFECKDNTNTNIFNLARIDLGMSRSFDYNKETNFMYYLNNNYNRKMSVLKLSIKDDDTLYFNTEGIITHKLSCIQYLLLKYGLKKSDWTKKNIDTDWIGFKYINTVIDKRKPPACDVNITQTKFVSRSERAQPFDDPNSKSVIMCLLFPLISIGVDTITSINEYHALLE